MKILVLNGGSSSVKALLSDVSAPLASRPPKPLWDARVDWGRHPGKAALHVQTAGGIIEEREIPLGSLRPVLESLLQTLWEGPTKVLNAPGEIAVAGHRIVHGGRSLRESTRITDKVKAEIARLAEFAPEHNRLELETVEAVERVLGPKVPQVAVFDTAFHATLPLPAVVYPGPYGWFDRGIQRYGFHGISHRYVSRRAAEIVGRDLKSLRILTCHLGNGCSLAAVRNGQSTDTTMGFTPLEGLMMGTRSGSIDPGIIVYLVRHDGCSADDLDRMLNEESGLKGVSGLSGDLREILAAVDKGDTRARLAFDVYVHRLCREIGGMLASLGGVDVLVFTAGVGENSARLRQIVCGRLDFLGIQIDPQKNASSPVDADIAVSDSRVRVLVIHTEEDWEIMRECYRLLQKPGT